MAEEAAARRLSGRAREGNETRARILEHAVQIASEEGLEALTIGRLADKLGLSKSGLFAHFGSKKGLQLATIEHAGAVFAERVVRIGRRAEPGLDRLRALLDAWLAYLESDTFRGGCFFAAASAEFDGRPGRVRDSIAARARAWIAALDAEVGKAISRGELGSGIDRSQLVFELHAAVQESNWARQLLDDPDAFTRARRVIERRLQEAGGRIREPSTR